MEINWLGIGFAVAGYLILIGVIPWLWSNNSDLKETVWARNKKIQILSDKVDEMTGRGNYFLDVAIGKQTDEYAAFCCIGNGAVQSGYDSACVEYRKLLREKELDEMRKEYRKRKGGKTK